MLQTELLSDSHFIDWTRGYATGPIKDYDNEHAKDVRMCQLFLYAFVRLLDAKVIVEIGTADASTTIALLKGAHETGGHVHSVDPAGCQDGQALVARCEYGARWSFNQTISSDFFATFDEPIDLAFIDGDHRPEAVYDDIKNVFRLLNPDGICVLHDWHVVPRDELQKVTDPYSCGVARALDKALCGIGAVYALPLWPRRSDSECMFLVLQRANESGNLDFFSRHGIP